MELVLSFWAGLAVFAREVAAAIGLEEEVMALALRARGLHWAQGTSVSAVGVTVMIEVVVRRVLDGVVAVEAEDRRPIVVVIVDHFWRHKVVMVTLARQALIGIIVQYV